ncbi:MAG: VCBS repeat-containing protein [Myxococcales bacterium]|nr:VCBS repeat-containing protein [Myxococcales bacterium]
MRTKQRQLNRGGLSPASLLVLILASPWGCGREPGLIVNITAWPAGVERIRVRPSLNGTADADIFINQDQHRFAVRLPVGSQGTVQLDAVGLDSVDCKLASGSLTEPIPSNLNGFAERTLEFSRLPSRVCVLATAIQSPAGTQPMSVAVGDFNSDKKPDLAVASYGSNEVNILLGNGLGGFAATAKIPFATNPSSVAVGDFNGDMKSDLAVSNVGNNSVSVLLGNGLGGFGSAVNFSVGTTPRSVVVGDVNGV